MVEANSEFVYTSKSLFWPDVIMLAAVDLDLLQSVSLAIGVQRQTDMNPITIVFAGINDHLHSRGFLSRLRDPTTAENAVWPAIKDILESMGEVVDATKEGSFNKVALRVVFGLKFVYAVVALLSEGKYDVIKSAPNRMIEMENLRPKIHAYLLKEVNPAENAGEQTAEFVNRMCQITLETFWTSEMKGQEGFERTDSTLEGLGAGWTASFLAKVYPKVSHYLIKEFLQAVVRVSIVELIALFVTFGAESFVKRPAILLTDGIQNLRLDGLLTLIAITHGNLGGLMKLTRCPEQMKERVRNLDMKKSTDSWNKIRDLRHTLIQYLLQQNPFGTGEDETIEREEDVRRHVGGMPLLTDLSLAMRTDPLALIRGVTEFVTVIYEPAVTFAFPDVKVEAYRRSVLHLNRISAVDGSTLNWCEQHTLRELMSEDLLFAKISEP